MTRKIILCMIVSSFVLSCTYGKKYKGAEYRTKEAFVYGRFEAHYKPANREGVVSSFFTYHDITDSTSWNEIDFEFIGRYANNIQFNVINKGYHIRNHYIDFDPYLDFHTYAFEWTPEYVAWFIDGVEVYRQSGIHNSTLIHPQKIMMNIWNPVFTGWVGYWDDAYLPAYSQYDWISYHSFTPGSGNSGTNNNFTQEWKDELDSFDDNRWQKATHTFGGNQCDFIPENVIFEDGIMTLALTSEDHTGGVDISPPVYMWARENYDKTVKVMFSEELDEVSAETISNYILPGVGVTITDAVLSEDKKYVTLYTDGYDLNAAHNLIVIGVTDDAAIPNTVATSNKTIIRIDPIEFPLAINVGGEAANNYVADQEWSENVEYGYWMGDIRNYPGREVSNSDNDQIYVTEKKGLITYKIRVPDGVYNVNLMFAENNSNQPGERVFDIVIEGETAVDNLDIAALAGSNTEYVLQKEVEVFDEVIDIYFSAQTDSAFVNAIQIYQLTTGIGTIQNTLPNDFSLFQNYPNPFNPTTTIKYTVPSVGRMASFANASNNGGSQSGDWPASAADGHNRVTLKIYNILGKEVATLVSEHQRPGNYQINFDAEELSSGIYICTLQAGNKFSSIKMNLIK